MAYSTIAQFRGNVSIGTTTNIADAIVTDRIATADKIVTADLNSVITFSAIVVTPSFIELLSQYKTAELCLVYMFGKKRRVDEVDDIDYWIKKYNELIEKILKGEIALEDGSTPAVSIAKGQQTFGNTAKSGIKPALGTGQFADWQSKSDLLDERPIE